MCFGDLFWGVVLVVWDGRRRRRRRRWRRLNCKIDFPGESSNEMRFGDLLCFFCAVLVVWADLRIPSCQNIGVYLKSLRRRRETFLIAQLIRKVSLCT